MNELYQLLNDPKFLLGFLANFFYIYFVWKSRKTSKPMRPIRISWFIFFILDVFITSNEYLNGKELSELGLHIGYMSGALLVFLISIPYGKWIDNEEKSTPFWKRIEFLILSLCLISSLIYLMGFGIISIICLAIALILGAWPTIHQIWKKPQSEAGAPWIMWLITASLSVYDLGPIQEWEFTKAFMPCVYLGLNLPIAWAIGNRKKK